jgi:branched-chain amino acid aminotransferase
MDKKMVSSAGLPWETLGFGETDEIAPVMYREEYRNGCWQTGQYMPFHDLSINPRAAALNYGVGAFEGLKAQVTEDGCVTLFRPMDNGIRLSSAAHRLCMPEITPPHFCRVMERLAELNAPSLPPYGKGMLYLRPILFGSGCNMRLLPPDTFTFVAYAFPCGAYFGKPLRILADPKHPRALPNGTGNIKSISNYSADYFVRLEARRQGFDEVLHLDARRGHLPEEIGAANVFFVLSDKTIVTPSLNRPILPGITRGSVIVIARDLGYTVQEHDVPLADLLRETREMFCTGTAIGIAPVGTMHYRKKDFEFHSAKDGSVMHRIRRAYHHILSGVGANEHRWIHPVPLG